MATILGKKDLDMYLFKLNKYFNEVKSIKSYNSSEKDFLDSEIKKYEKIINITLLKENNVLTTEDLEKKQITNKEKDEYMKKIENMKNDKIELMKKFKESIDYSNSLNSMLENEKANLQRNKDKLIVIEAKLHSLELSQNNYEINNKTLDIRTRNGKEIGEIIKKEINTTNQIFRVHNKTLDCLTGNLDTQNSEIAILKNKFEKMSKEKEKMVTIQKNNIIHKIKDIEIMHIKRKEKERNYIKLILGLDLISNYFLKQNEKKLLDSEEYRLFIKKSYQIVENSFKDNLKNELYKKNSENDIAEISLDFILEKYENLNISETNLHNLVFELISKKSFYHNFMNTFNNKQLHLETKKEKFEKKVNYILSNNSISLKEIGLNFNRLNKYLDYFENTKSNKKEHIIIPQFKPIDIEFYNRITGLFDYIRASFLSIFLILRENSDKITLKPKFLLFKAEIEELHDSNFEKINNFELFKKILNDYKIISLKNNDIKEKDYNEIQNLDQEFSKNLVLNILAIPKKVHFLFEFVINIDKVISILKDICHVHSSLYSQSLIKNVSIDDRFPNTSSNSINYKKRKTIMSGLEFINYGTNNNKIEESLSCDSLEEFYLKENDSPVKNSVFNLRTRNMIKSNGFLQRLSKNNELKSYNKIINEKMGVIKELTRLNKKEIFFLNKKNKELRKISKDLILYNNPNINLNSLQKNTYNSFVKYIIEKQVKANNHSNSQINNSKQYPSIRLNTRIYTSAK